MTGKRKKKKEKKSGSWKRPMTQTNCGREMERDVHIFIVCFESQRGSIQFPMTNVFSRFYFVFVVSPRPSQTRSFTFFHTLLPSSFILIFSLFLSLSLQPAAAKSPLRLIINYTKNLSLILIGFSCTKNIKKVKNYFERFFFIFVAFVSLQIEN
jgi:hypothetical protein